MVHIDAFFLISVLYISHSTSRLQGSNVLYVETWNLPSSTIVKDMSQLHTLDLDTGVAYAKQSVHDMTANIYRVLEPP